MLTDAEKKWAERQHKKHFSRLSFFSREDFSAPWFGSYSAKKIEALKMAISKAKEFRGWKIVSNEKPPYEICASESADWHVAKVHSYNVASFMCAVEPDNIADLLRYLENFRDSADFEARVAHHATNGYPLIGCPRCKYRAHGCYKIRHKLSGHWCFLKHARLAVEEEMEQAQCP